MLGRVLVIVATLAGCFVGVGLTVQPARADLECAIGGGENANLGPERLGGGATAWIPFLPQEDVKTAPDDPYLRVTSNHTLWEVVGPRGLLWSYTPKALIDGKYHDDKKPDDNFQNDCSLMDGAGTYIAQMIWELSRFLGGLTIGLKQLATNVAPFESFYSDQQALLNTLKNYFGIPAITIAVILTGYWVAIRIHRRADSRETYAGVIGAAVIVILIVGVLAGDNYRKITSGVDTATSDFNAAVMEIVTAKGSSESGSPCYLPTESGIPPNPYPSTSGQASAPGLRPPSEPSGDPNVNYNRGKRTSTCLLYEVLLFQPWVSGQFGSADQMRTENLIFKNDENGPQYVDHCSESIVEGKVVLTALNYRCNGPQLPPGADGKPGMVNLAVQQVIAQAITRNETESGVAIVPETHSTLWLGVRNAVAMKDASRYEFWRGAQPTGRMATAIAALVVNLIALVFIGILAVLTIFWHGVFFIGWIFLPVIGAIAAYPPARRIIRTWLGIMVQALFLRCVFGLVLAILLAVLNALQISEGGLAIKVLLMFVAAAAIWKVLSALRNGALAPQIVQEAAQEGMVPSDSSMDRGMSRVGSGAIEAVRWQRGRAHGARAGAAAAMSRSKHDPRSNDFWSDVRRGAALGRREGGRSTTARGRRRQLAEDRAWFDVERDANVGDKVDPSRQPKPPNRKPEPRDRKPKPPPS